MDSKAKKAPSMALNVKKFYNACNPDKTLNMGIAEDRQYYINFSSVRGGEIVEELGQAIALSDRQTCQFFTGHIGCGKSTELLRLKAELEQQGFHVVYFLSTDDLDMADLDISDILLVIARNVSESLEAVDINLKPGYFADLFTEISAFLQTPVDIGVEAGWSVGVAKITAKTKESPRARSQLREYLEKRTSNILESINYELLIPAIEELKRRGKEGLVVIIDNLDRVPDTPKPWGRPQPEYLFIDRGDQLSGLKCHLVYTVPLGLIFSSESGRMQDRLGDVRVLPMVPVQLRDGSDYQEGIARLRHMAMVRAFPNLAQDEDELLKLVTEVFDSFETLDRLCRVSGGHVRNLLRLLHTCIPKKRLPISRDSLESVVRQFCNQRTLGLKDEDWNLLRQVAQQKKVRGVEGERTLLRSMLVFEYRDQDGSWFDINPVLAEAKEFKL